MVWGNARLQIDLLRLAKLTGNAHSDGSSLSQRSSWHSKPRASSFILIVRLLSLRLAAAVCKWRRTSSAVRTRNRLRHEQRLKRTTTITSKSMAELTFTAVHRDQSIVFTWTLLKPHDPTTRISQPVCVRPFAKNASLCLLSNSPRTKCSPAAP